MVDFPVKVKPIPLKEAAPPTVLASVENSSKRAGSDSTKKDTSLNTLKNSAHQDKSVRNCAVGPV